MIDIAADLSEPESVVNSSTKCCTWLEFAVHVVFLITIPILINIFVKMAIVSEPNGEAPVTLADLLAGRYVIDPPNSTWHHDALLYRNGAGDLVLFNATSAQQTIIVDRHQNPLNSSHSHQLSADGQFVMFSIRDQNDSPANDFLSWYSVHRVQNDSQPLQKVQLEDQFVSWQYATFGPRHNQLVYVLRNDIYYKPNVTLPFVRLTTTGSHSYTNEPYVRNGLMHPAYRRDIFVNQLSAMWFSSHGQYLAIAEFNESSSDQALPVVNQTLPQLRVRIVDLDAMNGTGPQWHDCTPLRGTPGEPSVLVSIAWASVPGATKLERPQRVVIVWTNRQRTSSYVQVCMAASGESLILVNSINTRYSWPNAPRPVWLDDQFNGEVLLMQPSPTNRFKVLRAYPSEPLKRHEINYGADNSRMLNMDEVNVQRILHWDTRSHVVFFLANTLSMPEESHLYAVIGRPNVHPYGQCLTCRLASYTHFDVRFSGVGNFLWLASQGPPVPRYDVYQWMERNLTVSIRHAHTMRTFAALRQHIAAVGEPVIVHHTAIINEQRARIQLTYPPGYTGRPMEQPFALLVVPYAGPGTFAGTASWRLEWPEYLVLKRKIVVARVDVRGSERQGTFNAWRVIERLGRSEAVDTIAVVE